MIKKILFIFIISYCSFCMSQDTDKHISYVNEESSEINVDSSKFYYITNKSDSVFFKNMKRSFISFVKGDRSVSIDELNDSKPDGEIQLNNSCGIKALNLKMIENNLNRIKNYNGIEIKSIMGQDVFNLKNNKITAVMLYSKKLRYVVEPYLNKLNELKEEYGIDYILITLDTTLIDSLPDSYKNMDVGM